MGRPISAEHYQALRDEWRGQLLAVEWRATVPISDVLRLAHTIGTDPSGIDAAERSHLKRALKGLRAALLTLGENGKEGQCPDALDDWIDRHLLVRGHDLLIPEARRRAMLVRCRDGARRQRHAEEGMHSARVEMREEAWAKLRLIMPEFQKLTSGKVSLGQALERVINAHFERVKASERRGTNKGVPKA
jgi:hypothetical protein